MWRLLFFSALALPLSRAAADEPNPFLADERGELADPNLPATEVGFRNGMRAKTGLPIPFFRGPHGGVGLRGFLAIHDETLDRVNGFPFHFWRGYLALGGHLRTIRGPWTLRLALHAEHESDHQSVRAFVDRDPLDPYHPVFRNAGVLEGDAEVALPNARVFSRVGFRYHLITCTTASTPCEQRFSERSHGPELTFDFSARFPEDSGARAVVAVHAAWTPGRGEIITERRWVAATGVQWRGYGTWHVLGTLWAGNTVGQTRAVRDVWLGLTLRYSPWAHD